MYKFGYPDQPVHGVDEDLFNVQLYIDGLCEFIQYCDTPMTISIQGDWGSGKTSMMNMIKESLGDKVYPVWFNTWQFSQFNMGQNLIFSMLTVLLKELDCEREYIKSIISGFIGVAKNVALLATDMTLGGYATKKIGHALAPDTTIDYANEVMVLKEKFQDAVDKKIIKENCDRVVIFVDDLDRLQPGKAVEVLEILKLFLDCEKCVFLLAVDYEVVSLGIKEKFGDDVLEEKGKSFFDKIIQLPFKMPVAQYDVRRYVTEVISCMGMNIENVNLYVALIQTSIGFNPRSMKRLFNTFQLLDIISREAVQDLDSAIRQRVLFAIICMQTKFEGLYKYFASVPGSLNLDNINIFVTQEAYSKIIKDQELVSIITDEEDDDDVEREVKEIIRFMKLFLRAIQLDTDASISEEEVQLLEKVMKCSTITSIGKTYNEYETDRERAFRAQNRSLAKEINEALSPIVELYRWLPRKTRSDMSLSYVAGYRHFSTPNGFQFTYKYYIDHIGSSQDIIGFAVVLRSGDEQEFANFVNDNPLPHLGVLPMVKEPGYYNYRVKVVDIYESELIVSTTIKFWKIGYEDLVNNWGATIVP